MSRERRGEGMIRGSRGFTLAELLVVLAMIIVMVSLAYPFFLEWRMGMDSGRAARLSYDVLRQARGRAMSSNFQQMVSFDPAGCRIQVLRGKRAYQTPAGEWDTDNPVQGWLELGRGVTMSSGADGSSTATVNVQFNADGTARLESPAGTRAPGSSVSVSLQGGSDRRKRIVMVATCGRIIMQ
jgi:prepilin-type N-terminal cleavage/methylation domain-containing protein